MLAKDYAEVVIKNYAPEIEYCDVVEAVWDEYIKMPEEDFHNLCEDTMNIVESAGFPVYDVIYLNGEKRKNNLIVR